jgi:hypothetical protein
VLRKCEISDSKLAPKNDGITETNIDPKNHTDERGLARKSTGNAKAE